MQNNNVIKELPQKSAIKLFNGLQIRVANVKKNIEFCNYLGA